MLNYLEHPEEETLERFVLHQSGEEETEIVETHILACDSCVSRLEALEVEVAAMQLALQGIRNKEAVADVAARQKSSARNWFSLPKLSLAGGLAALALGLLVVPQFRNGGGALPMAQVSLMANRGSEITVVPKGRPLHVLLNATDLNQKQLEVRLTDSNGKDLWKGSAAVQQDRAVVDLPRIVNSGEHYVRLYSTSPHEPPELLREFPLSVR